MQRLFSGIQPSGEFHLGNYLGAVSNWVSMQEDYDSFFCVVDLHALTQKPDPVVLRENTARMIKMLLASGIHPDRSVIFVQSHVSAHAELQWIMNTVARMGELERMTQFKDKTQGEEKEHVSVGLFDYPVLMAADILLYGTHVVPVGEDQIQHMELARSLARRFNKRYGETFLIPKAFVKDKGARIMGLDDSSKKMSKSATSAMNYISLSDTPDDIEKKIKKAQTDSGSEIEFTDQKPALQNLLTIYSLVSGRETHDIVSEYAGKGYAEFKEGLAQVVVDFVSTFQNRFNGLSDEDVESVVNNGARRANEVSQEMIARVKERVGLG